MNGIQEVVGSIPISSTTFFVVSQHERDHMKSYLIGFFSLAWLMLPGPVMAQVGVDWVAYKPGIVKALLAKGETTLLHYRSTW